MSTSVGLVNRRYTVNQPLQGVATTGTFLQEVSGSSPERDATTFHVSKFYLNFLFRKTNCDLINIKCICG